MSMTPDQMIQFVDDLYAASGAGDFETAATMVTDDFFITEADCMPMAGTYRGRPVDVAVMKDGSLLISDDYAGAIYRVTYNP